jgi:hypothetical protein
LHISSFAFYTAVLYCPHESRSSGKTGSIWQKTPVANLMRHKPSGNYYARIRVGGKLIWKSMKTDPMSVAKIRSTIRDYAGLNFNRGINKLNEPEAL